MKWISSPVQLANEYREKKKLTDKLKEELQTKINEYTKFAEQGQLYMCVYLFPPSINALGSNLHVHNNMVVLLIKI